CVETLARSIDNASGLQLLRGKAVIEVKSVGVNKGLAIQAFMNEAPFAGRSPVFAGDDLTDEAGFAVVQRLGGAGIKVGAGASCARHRCDNPEALRAWLADALQTPLIHT
ncbi:MAG: trehalose-phosphatase, partial [Hydrogenophaga sp.]|nr:trehalose-phosphatase [Hydrogenophaga sp.]